VQSSQRVVKGDIHFGQSDGPEEFWQMRAKPFGTADASVALYRGERGVEDRAGIAECREDYMIVHHLKPFVNHEEWRNDRPFRVDDMPQGSFVFYDMRDQWQCHLPEAFHTVNIFLPQAAFDRFNGKQPNRARNALSWEHGTFTADPVFQHLVMALMGGMAHKATKDTLFADHVLEAMIAHIAQRYAKLEDIFSPRGKLAPWQERRAKELMMSRLAEEISVLDLAEACGISADHFGKMFRMSTGQTPHQWLRNQRLRMAQDFLLNSELGLSEIALICGFSHQSHFTRVFSQHVGTSPAAWRRISRS
jgi:AraC family transcriptional regulator